MSAPTPYLYFDGNAAEALRFYRAVFGGEVTMHTFADFARTDGPSDAIAHGELRGPVDLSGTDVVAGEQPLRLEGLRLALLGAAPPDVLTEWFECLSEGGDVVTPLAEQSWGDVDGTVRDRFGLTWLIGYSGDASVPE